MPTGVTTSHDGVLVAVAYEGSVVIYLNQVRPIHG